MSLTTVSVLKRNGKIEKFNINKIHAAIKKAFAAVNETIPKNFLGDIDLKFIALEHDEEQPLPVDKIQDLIEKELMFANCFETAKAYIVYREKHKELRFIKERAEYIENYIESSDNAATASEVDANANIQNKNVATLEAELFKSLCINLSRYRVEKKLEEMYGAIAPNYAKDLESHIIYKHDEGASPAIKPYCVAINMYPFLLHGTSSLDKLHTEAPKNLNSFTGQFNNLIFLISSQFLGAVAVGEFFNVFNYFCIKQWGPDYYKMDSTIVSQRYQQESDSKSAIKKILSKFRPNDLLGRKETISQTIEQAFQNIVYSINQPAGNRSYQSPFTNISYYDHNYWNALFADFAYPDGSKPEWNAINYLQKKFMKWFNKERTKCLLTFPVETVAMLTDGKDVIDKEWKNFTAEMYAEGHSFFTYMSDSADSLSSCCRLKNKIDKPAFSFTNGSPSISSGSKSVITINLNRFVQSIAKQRIYKDKTWENADLKAALKDELVKLLHRIYKYHSAYNELLWELYNKGMLPVYSSGYINLNQQFLTIGINGLNEAAEFLSLKINDNKDYNDFCNLMTKTISDENRKAEQSPYDKGHKLKFNTEFVPAENLALKNYNWDKEDGYWVPSDRNLYNSYFYKPEDESISVLEKFRLHGKRYVDSLDGGVALHLNLQENLSKQQYLMLIDYAIKCGTNYWTINCPQSSCDDCGYIMKHPVKKCPRCGSENITLWTRIIGYLRPIKNFSKGRRIEAKRRVYSKKVS